MNFIIFSPLSTKSAIAKTTQLIVEALDKKKHKVFLVRSEDTSYLKTHPHPHLFPNHPVLHWHNPYQITRLLESQTIDAVIYQIGDNYTLHQGCLEWLPHLPGIVCLHDYFLANLFCGWTQQYGQEQAKQILKKFYSKKIAEQFFSFKNPEEFIHTVHHTAPMTEWIAEMAHAVITHANWAIKRVLNHCPGPVYVTPLPYKAQNKDFISQASSNLFSILTIGHINVNKRTESIIQAIGQSNLLREKVIYQLAGHIEPEMEKKLVTLAQKLSVRLSIQGFVDDTQLHQMLCQANIICCLRYPALEAASASTIEAMLYGKAVVVMNTGFYQELPDHLVYKIDPENEIQTLKEKLEFLYQNPETCLKTGQAASEWAKATFSADHYADQLVQMSLKLAQEKPIISAVSYFATILNQWDSSDRMKSLPELLKPLSIFES